jgi:L-rhamnose isomerase
VYERLGDDQRFLLEYKLFEPAFYSTDVPDWGTSYAHCVKLGPKAHFHSILTSFNQKQQAAEAITIFPVQVIALCKLYFQSAQA